MLWPGKKCRPLLWIMDPRFFGPAGREPQRNSIVTQILEAGGLARANSSDLTVGLRQIFYKDLSMLPQDGFAACRNERQAETLLQFSTDISYTSGLHHDLLRVISGKWNLEISFDSLSPWAA